MTLSLAQYFQLLRRYLQSQQRRIVGLALLLISSIGLQLISPQVIRSFLDQAQAGAVSSALLGVAALFLLVVLLQRCAAIATTYVSQQVAWTATNALRRDLTQHVLKLDMTFHNAHTPGELLERIDGDVDYLANFFSEFLLQIVSGALLTVGVLILLGREDWRLSLLLTGFVLAYLLVHVRGQGLAAPEWAKERAYTADLSSFVEERLAGVRDIQTSGAVSYTMHRFYELVRRRTWQALRADVVTDVGWTISKIFYDLGTAAGLGLGAYLFLQGEITLGTVYLIIHYLGLINGPLNQIASQLEDWQRAQIAIGRVKTLFDTPGRVVDGEGAPLPTGALGVRFDGVSFCYNDDAPILRAVDFVLTPGQKLGVLGRTGSGKTTIARLLFRLYDVNAGCIQLAEVDIRSLRLTDLRQRVGMVTQEVQLFPASLRDNLTLFDATIPDAAIWTGLRQLGLEHWVQRLPQGLDTQLAADGGGLSAGEAQLLALARVFLKDPGLVILDEASSRLDSATERLLEQALDTLLAGRTAIIIAHRLTTVQRADAVLLLAQGQVQEFGAPTQLAADPNSHFARLLQTAAEQTAVLAGDEPIIEGDAPTSVSSESVPVQPISQPQEVSA